MPWPAWAAGVVVAAAVAPCVAGTEEQLLESTAKLTARARTLAGLEARRVRANRDGIVFRFMGSKVGFGKTETETGHASGSPQDDETCVRACGDRTGNGRWLKD
jgi:hypothetical protein